ncbi:MAG TPA: hypothetical protein VN155_07925, partial [Devosia sp.]|nr:hypothetical protein [Devosia sp.]
GSRPAPEQAAPVEAQAAKPASNEDARPQRGRNRRPAESRADESGIDPSSPFGNDGPIPAFLLRSTRTAT